MNLPFKNRRITQSMDLYGRKNDLSNLISLAQKLNQVQIIGARRFGKTCLSLCLESELRGAPNSVVYPIFTDLKSDRIKHTKDVYNYLSSKIIAALSSDGIITERISYEGIGDFTPNPNWHFVFNELSSIENSIFLFESLIHDMAQRINKTFLILFDEYEYMAKSAFDDIEDFMPMRTMADTPMPSGLFPLSYWIIGAMPWSDYVVENRLTNVPVIGGSGEFNGIGVPYYLSPICKEDFIDYWNSQCMLIEDESLRCLIQEKAEQAYASSGGVFFYANAIANELQVKRVYPDYTILRSHFVELGKILDEQQKDILNQLVTPQRMTLSDSLRELVDYALVESNDENYRIRIGFLADYFRSQSADNLTTKTVSESVSSPQSDSRDVIKSKLELINEIVNRVKRIINNVNQTYNHKRGKHIFQYTSKSERNLQILRDCCYDDETFGKVADAMYKLYYESSKGSRTIIDKTTGESKRVFVPGQRIWDIPDHSYRQRDFFRIIEPLRGYYAAHEPDLFDRSEDQWGVGDALQYLQGNKNEPFEQEEWVDLQISLLSAFEVELKEIRVLVNSL